MVKLIIKDPGMFISLPGMPSFRTPCEIDITKYDINFIIAEMTRNGITEYKIESSSITRKEAPKNKPPQKKKIKVEPAPPKDDVDKRLDTIEVLLKQLIEKDDSRLPSESTTKRMKRIIEKDDEFIPSVDIGNLEIQGDISSEQGNIDDVTENIELLRKLEKDGGNNG